MATAALITAGAVSVDEINLDAARAPAPAVSAAAIGTSGAFVAEAPTRPDPRWWLTRPRLPRRSLRPCRPSSRRPSSPPPVEPAPVEPAG